MIWKPGRDSADEHKANHLRPVICSVVANEDDARPFAEAYCHKFGKTAHFEKMMRFRQRRIISNSASFHCVPRAD
jgi:hypothetical protein